MKTVLQKALTTLLYPVRWCCQTLQDAARICGSLDSTDSSDYMSFDSPSREPLCNVIPARASSGWVPGRRC